MYEKEIASLSVRIGELESRLRELAEEYAQHYDSLRNVRDEQKRLSKEVLLLKGEMNAYRRVSAVVNSEPLPKNIYHRKKKLWTDMEIQYLKSNYGVIPIEEISQRLGRTEGSVIQKAHTLGISRKRRTRRTK